MPESTATPKTVRVLSIDALRESEGGWTWNNWHHVGDAPIEWCALKPRTLLRAMREGGYLSPFSRGRCAVDDDGYNVTIVARGTGEPLFALEYGPHF
jgi:hypothetical protein